MMLLVMVAVSFSSLRVSFPLWVWALVAACTILPIAMRLKDHYDDPVNRALFNLGVGWKP